MCVGFPSKDTDDPDEPDESFFEMGISVDWADIYPWYIAEQYIDITDDKEVPDGDYTIIVRQDVDNQMLEKHQEQHRNELRAHHRGLRPRHTVRHKPLS